MHAYKKQCNVHYYTKHTLLQVLETAAVTIHARPCLSKEATHSSATTLWIEK